MQDVLKSKSICVTIRYSLRKKYKMLLTRIMHDSDYARCCACEFFEKMLE